MRKAHERDATVPLKAKVNLGIRGYLLLVFPFLEAYHKYGKVVVWLAKPGMTPFTCKPHRTARGPCTTKPISSPENERRNPCPKLKPSSSQHNIFYTTRKRVRPLQTRVLQSLRHPQEYSIKAWHPKNESHLEKVVTGTVDVFRVHRGSRNVTGGSLERSRGASRVGAVGPRTLPSCVIVSFKFRFICKVVIGISSYSKISMIIVMITTFAIITLLTIIVLFSYSRFDGDDCNYDYDS